MVKSSVFVLLVLATISATNGNVVAPRTCGGKLFVEDAVVINAPFHENCVWEIQTREDHILVFTVIEGNLREAQDFITIHDGFSAESPILLVENQKIYERTRKDLPTAVYTTHSTASLRFKKTATSPFQIKIQKAVDCPFNLGSNSQCGRVFDELSCYCATFTLRNQPDQKLFCSDNGMLLISLESQEEEQSITQAWGTAQRYWTSLSDNVNEGMWIWETTGALLSGYIHWYPGQPDNGGAFYNEHCVTMNYASAGWGDTQCKDDWEAICEQHPV